MAKTIIERYENKILKVFEYRSNPARYLERSKKTSLQLRKIRRNLKNLNKIMDKLKTSDEQKAKLVQEEYVDRINRNLSDFKKYIDFTEPVIEAVVVKLQGSGPSSPYDIAYSAKSFLHDLSYEFPYIGDEFDVV